MVRELVPTTTGKLVGWGQQTLQRVDALLGGPARRWVITVLATTLALDSADKATVGATSTQLQAALHIGRTDIGLLISVTSLVGALATVPFGVLVDRTKRVRLLTGAVLFWGAAMVVCGASTSFLMLLLCRLALGSVTAVAGPALASLVGDYFPESERGRIYGFILTGELVGAGFGFLVSGLLASVSWRLSFWALALPAALVVWLLRRLPEPARGGASRMPSGAGRLPSAEALRRGDVEPYPIEATPGEPDKQLAREAVADQGIEPHPDLVLHEDPVDMRLRDAARYVLRVRTNVVLIVASALGYFFFAGVRGFGVEFVKKQYDLSQSVASSLTIVLGVGAIVGVLAGGRLGDHLLERRRPSGRVVVAGTSVLLAALLFLPAMLTTSVAVALPALIGATASLGATNPPMDAARLDIMPPRLWGRAEAVRTVLRNTAEAAAPLLFGFVSDQLFTGKSALQHTFLVMLVPLAVAATLALVIGRRTYPRDVATAAASARAMRE